MKSMIRTSLCFLAAASLVAPAFAAEVLPLATPGPDRDARIAKAAAQFEWVSSYASADARAYDVQVSADRLAELKSNVADDGPLWLGVDADVDFTFRPGLKRQPIGNVMFHDGGMVWTGTFRSEGANAVRLRLDDVNLPEGAELYVFGSYGHVFGPYTSGDIAEGTNVLWTNTVAGDSISLQAHMPLNKVRTVRGSMFKVGSLSHLGDNYAFGAQAQEKAFCSWNDSCIRNASCENIPNAVQVAEDAAAYLLYSVNGSTYLCTGGLINDTANSGTPYLLTANHCFSSQTSASSLEAYFQWSVGCGSSCGTQYFPPGSVSVVNGSTLLATDAGTDFTLVQLNSAAPAGTALLGWTTTPVANSAGTNLYRVSHPAGSPQAYSEQSVNTSAGTCRTLPRGDFIYSDATLGDTEGGSSGSPVVNGNGQVVGQLYGACGASPSTTCDDDDRTVDGAFAVTFNSVSQWLDPGSGPTCGQVGDSCSTNSDCCNNKCRGRSGRKTCK